MKVPQLVIEEFMARVPDGCSPGTHQGGLVDALTAGITAWEDRKEAPEAPHEHHWTAWRVKNDSILGVKTTHVLRKCPCGRFGTDTLAGHWTVADLGMDVTS